ncbi:MAG: fused MFS/spermidine synthase [Betaproteobacteria bacterium]|nr:fused MFS/spermidine synthase [Betaproteobacteria bacterium]
MRIARPYALELEYTREMMGCLLLRTEADWPGRVLQVGLGAASLTKFWHRHRPQTLQTVLEINPGVVAMAYAAFRLPRDAARIDIEVTDAVAWMAEPRRTKFDCLMVDGYDEHARFGALGSEAFYADGRRHLSRDGVMVINLFGRSRGYARQVDALRDVFKGRVLALDPVEGGNAIAFAWAGERPVLDADSLHERATALRAEVGINFSATVARMVRAAATA